MVAADKKPVHFFRHTFLNRVAMKCDMHRAHLHKEFAKAMIALRDIVG